MRKRPRDGEGRQTEGEESRESTWAWPELGLAAAAYRFLLGGFIASRARVFRLVFNLIVVEISVNYVFRRVCETKAECARWGGGGETRWAKESMPSWQAQRTVLLELLIVGGVRIKESLDLAPVLHHMCIPGRGAEKARVSNAKISSTRAGPGEGTHRLPLLLRLGSTFFTGTSSSTSMPDILSLAHWACSSSLREGAWSAKWVVNEINCKTRSMHRTQEALCPSDVASGVSGQWHDGQLS